MSPLEQGAESTNPPEQASLPTAPTAPPSREPPDPAGQQGVAETAPVVSPEAEQPAKRRLLYVTLPGCWGGLIFGCLSFTPSLLPRGGLIQGIVFGITAAIGYGLGVIAAWIWRAFADRDPRRPRRRSWLVFFIAGGVLYAVSFGLGQYWQYEIRKLMAVTDYNIALVVASPFVAALVFALLVAIGRGIRGAYRWLARLLNRWIGRRAANAVGWIAVAGLVYLVVTGLLLQGLVNVMNSAFSLRDTTTAEGVHQPTTSLRSGGPGSLIPWDTLGFQGRNFIGKGPTVSELDSFTHHQAMEPIRIYSGLASAADAQARADLAVRDLERAGGFQRKDLLVVTTTGSGWVDPALVDSFEYLTGGDSATVAMQYSYLPSWISYLVDQSKAQEAGRDLFERGLRRLVTAPPGPAAEAVRRRGEPGVVRRRGGLQRRIRPAQPHRRRPVRRAAELQYPVPRIPRPPRPRQPGSPARLQGRTDRAVQQ